MGASKRCVTPERQERLERPLSRFSSILVVRRPSAHAGPQNSVPHAVKGVPVTVPPAAQEENKGKLAEEKEAAAFARSSVVESLFREACAEHRAAS